ncbi:sigma-54-dependent Fis family transcriptional regulator [Allosphingosinicella flava]|uniref:Sigma-54-dependent Fis family transcriptional regulator n=1 Tax=Allosphingosinicella flava TaxID=2771430 RepID=A0A7T2GK54_9SPHN|nr:sigma-54 dependent transcriptional regulator [Sphingosinicella flava]QPQ55366.1 sigma-54-dependent Fis family transcriptional regulator [Sphingosinicella flava]
MSVAWSPPVGEGACADSLIVGVSPGIAELKYLIRQVAPTSASVIVTGPSGCGKEMVARAIHAESRRAAKSYVALNCGAIPRDLLESELFGHEKGSFTGALAQRRGRFEEADGGTLFLDEIGDMPADMQVKLLRVLEGKSIQRVGGRGEIAIDSRIVSATHRNLDDAIGQQNFREDLYYRLAVFPLEVLPLCERREDVPLLVRHFLRQIADTKQTVRFTPDAIEKLAAHPWPGNVRELRNIVERAVILYAGQTVGAEQIELLFSRRPRMNRAERDAIWQASGMVSPIADAAFIPAASAKPAPLSLKDEPIDLRAVVADLERQHIADALKSAKGVVADAARMLSLQRTTLIEKMRKYGLAKDDPS